MTELERLIDGIAANAGTGMNLLTLAVLAACIVLAWFVARRLRARVAARESDHWKFGQGGFARVAFPLVALVLVWLAKVAFRRWNLAEATPVLDLAVTLLVALAIVRFVVYVLREVLPEGGLLRGSERTVGWGIWIGVALYLAGLLPEIADALDDLAFHAG